jgi:hypothetical protein
MKLISYNESGFAFVEDCENYIWIRPPYSEELGVDYKIVGENLVAGSFTVGDFTPGPNKEFVTMKELIEFLQTAVKEANAELDAWLSERNKQEMIEAGVDITDENAVRIWNDRQVIRGAMRFLTEEHFDGLIETIAEQDLNNRPDHIPTLLEEYRAEAELKGKSDLVKRIDRYQAAIKIQHA